MTQTIVFSETEKKGNREEELDKYIYQWRRVDKNVEISALIKKSWQKRIINWEFRN